MLEELIAYYVNLLIIQYQALANAQAVVALLAGETLADLIIQQVGEAFTLGTAIGAQLDILGQFRGVSRNVYGPDLNKKYFGLPPYNNPALAVGGMNAYGLAPNNFFFYEYTDSNYVEYVMTDDEYTTMIEFKAAADAMRPVSIEGIDDIIEEFLTPYYGFTDNENMTATFIQPLVDTDTTFAIAFAAGYIPRDAGVSYTSVRAASPAAIFDIPLYAAPTPAGAAGLTTYSGSPLGGSIIEYA